MKKQQKLVHLLSLSFLLAHNSIWAQFPGAAGTPGTTAMYKDSSAFIGWATGCTVSRGYLDISDPGAGYTTFGADTSAIGQADGTDVVSLGDAGSATLTFAQPLTDGPGFDFAVFENAFNNHFLELAFVEVSSDGIQFVRFPATSVTQTLEQIGPFDDVTDATEVDNLAGKYRAEYGTPFDLSQLAGTAGLDIYAVTHVRIVDAVGSIDHTHASFDQNGTPVNDPFPTPFPSGGFDLDAVGAIHQLPAGIADMQKKQVLLCPNPLSTGEQLALIGSMSVQQVTIYAPNGKCIGSGKPLEIFQEFTPEQGVYVIVLTSQEGQWIEKLIVTD